MNYRIFLCLFVIFVVFSCEEDDKDELPIQIENQTECNIDVTIDDTKYMLAADEVKKITDVAPGYYEAVFVAFPEDTIGIIKDFPVEREKTAFFTIYRNKQGEMTIYNELKDLD